MIWGAWKRNGELLLVPAALFGIAFAGRAVSLVYGTFLNNLLTRMPPCLVNNLGVNYFVIRCFFRHLGLVYRI
jgi:hypothetical protein